MQFPLQFCYLFNEEWKQMQKNYAKTDFFPREDISFYPHRYIFSQFMRNESIATSFILIQILHVSRSSRNRDEQEHRTSDKIASKKLKNQKRVDSRDPLQKNNNSENPSNFWEACRNRCTRRRMTRNHCLGNGKPHQLVHNTPKSRRIGGRWNSKVACYTRFGLGEGNDDVSSHCRSSRPRYD